MLRELGIQDVPTEKDIAQKKIVLTAIHKEFMTARNNVKAKVHTSLSVHLILKLTMTLF